jgi:hypothetical protein
MIITNFYSPKSVAQDRFVLITILPILYRQELSSSNTNKKVKRMPGSARMGLTLLLIGAILVGVGTYVNRGAISLYGLTLVIIGFSTYMISSIIVSKRKRN